MLDSETQLSYARAANALNGLSAISSAAVILIFSALRWNLPVIANRVTLRLAVAISVADLFYSASNISIDDALPGSFCTTAVAINLFSGLASMFLSTMVAVNLQIVFLVRLQNTLWCEKWFYIVSIAVPMSITGVKLLQGYLGWGSDECSFSLPPSFTAGRRVMEIGLAWYFWVALSVIVSITGTITLWLGLSKQISRGRKADHKLKLFRQLRQTILRLSWYSLVPVVSQVLSFISFGLDDKSYLQALSRVVIGAQGMLHSFVFYSDPSIAIVIEDLRQYMIEKYVLELEEQLFHFYHDQIPPDLEEMDESSVSSRQASVYVKQSDTVVGVPSRSDCECADGMKDAATCESVRPKFSRWQWFMYWFVSRYLMDPLDGLEDADQEDAEDDTEARLLAKYNGILPPAPTPLTTEVGFEEPMRTQGARTRGGDDYGFGQPPGLSQHFHGFTSAAALPSGPLVVMRAGEKISDPKMQCVDELYGFKIMSIAPSSPPNPTGSAHHALSGHVVALPASTAAQAGFRDDMFPLDEARESEENLDSDKSANLPMPGGIVKSSSGGSDPSGAQRTRLAPIQDLDSSLPASTTTSMRQASLAAVSGTLTPSPRPSPRAMRRNTSYERQGISPSSSVGGAHSDQAAKSGSPDQAAQGPRRYSRQRSKSASGRHLSPMQTQGEHLAAHAGASDDASDPTRVAGSGHPGSSALAAPQAALTLQQLGHSPLSGSPKTTRNTATASPRLESRKASEVDTASGSRSSLQSNTQLSLSPSLQQQLQMHQYQYQPPYQNAPRTQRGSSASLRPLPLGGIPAYAFSHRQSADTSAGMLRRPSMQAFHISSSMRGDRSNNSSIMGFNQLTSRNGANTSNYSSASYLSVSGVSGAHYGVPSSIHMLRGEGSTMVSTESFNPEFLSESAFLSYLPGTGPAYAQPTQHAQPHVLPDGHQAPGSASRRNRTGSIASMAPRAGQRRLSVLSQLEDWGRQQRHSTNPAGANPQHPPASLSQSFSGRHRQNGRLSIFNFDTTPSATSLADPLSPTMPHPVLMASYSVHQPPGQPLPTISSADEPATPRVLGASSSSGSSRRQTHVHLDTQMYGHGSGHQHQLSPVLQSATSPKGEYGASIGAAHAASDHPESRMAGSRRVSRAAQMPTHSTDVTQPDPSGYDNGEPDTDGKTDSGHGTPPEAAARPDRRRISLSQSRQQHQSVSEQAAQAYPGAYSSQQISQQSIPHSYTVSLTSSSQAQGHAAQPMTAPPRTIRASRSSYGFDGAGLAGSSSVTFAGSLASMHPAAVHASMSGKSALGSQMVSGGAVAVAVARKATQLNGGQGSNSGTWKAKNIVLLHEAW
ncbi:hypothetical protein HK105_204413 [Polyrhizophydium stewartii]|uniref:G-protein coupled receptors family 2 profile 2 domain-containing protein n=1 Tax=Polyrhizophydium stewartii TaxID=2732419 RepID=A0ABR4N961_9FUNG